MTQSPSFGMSDSNNETIIQQVNATNTNSASGDYGRVYSLEKRTVYSNGDIQAGWPKYFDVVTDTDVTAIVTGADYTIDLAPIRVQYQPAVNIAVNGATVTSLGTPPAFATYAEVYIDASPTESGVRWTIDGSAPADNNGEQDNMGSTIRLQEREEISGFRAVAINNQGDIDAAGVANLTINYWNISPDED